jgi:RNA polymerase sigma-70 factor (ECF subfamily)
MLAARLHDVPVPDEALVARARGGARSAFAELVSRYQDRVYRLALRMSHDPFDAEEIAQETFLLAYRAIASFHGESRFATWLYRIAVNQVLMRRRAARRRPVQSLEGLLPHASDRGIAGTADGEPPADADDLVDRKRVAERVHAALAGLDDSFRTALVLRDLEGLSAEDAAEILGLSPEAVRQRAHRGRLQLRDQLRDLVQPVRGAR